MRSVVFDSVGLPAVRTVLVTLGLLLGVHVASASVRPVASVSCPDPAPPAKPLGGTCGKVLVPLDRNQPLRGNIEIFFRLYQSTNATGVIVPRQGGPGPTSTGPQFVTRVRAVMAPLFMSGWSILFIDQRGRGGSGAINCTDIQNNGPSPAGIAACAASLVDATGVPGSGADLYSTAAAADDLEDVRQSLVVAGLIPDAPLDLFGQSYGGVDIEAYAARYPQRVRSMVGDSPYSSTSDFFGTMAAQGLFDTVTSACALNAACPSQGPEVVNLINTLRTNPVSGQGVDLTGKLVNVTASESNLLYSVLYTQPVTLVAQLNMEFLNQGEIAAAARAYFAGDRTPLFRLLAENAAVLQPAGSELPYTLFSYGNTAATLCADSASAPWTWGSPGAAAEYQAALDSVPLAAIAPFSRSAWSDLLTYTENGTTCLPWPTSPIAPLPVSPPTVTAPVLAISPSMDNAVPPAYASLWANRYPNSRIASLVGRGHIPAVRADACARAIVRSFIANPYAALDTSCAQTPQILPLATGDFPLNVSNAREATINAGAGTDQSRQLERKQATVAVATALDALKRFTMAGSANPYSSTGLRGGKVSGAANSQGAIAMNLSNARFVQDVDVTGNVSWDPATFALAGTLVLATTGGSPIGTVDVSGTWRKPGQGALRVSGKLNGRIVALLVPST